MPTPLPTSIATGTLGQFSRVCLDVTTGVPYTTLFRSRKTVSSFHYDLSNKLDYIDQYAQTTATTMTTTFPTSIATGTLGQFSRLFFDVTTGDAIGSISADRKTVSSFHYDLSNKLDYID